TITSHSSPYEVQNLPFTLLWEPVKHATSYHIDILDTMNWETVYSIKDLRTTSLDIDLSLFEIGGSYRLYLFADLGLSSSAPTYFDITTPELAPPTIIEPANNILLPHDDIHLRWEENPFATSYKIVVTNTFSWESIYEKKLEEGNTLLIEKSLLTLGSPYRIYIMSLNGSIESVPAYLDVEIQGLPIPEILSPKSGTQYEDQEIRIQWKPNPYITTYKITLVDMTSWTTVFQNEGLVDTEILLDKNLLTTGTIYRAYVQSVMGSIESEPGYVDISLK
ncbi:MAG: hypothetical protein JW708_04630, partial [Vallitaleaceae bacterium]|nr:hypothetical protein [Vallitaleaceae bacterium]